LTRFGWSLHADYPSNARLWTFDLRAVRFTVIIVVMPRYRE
jgi:hypothetical protein